MNQLNVTADDASVNPYRTSSTVFLRQYCLLALTAVILIWMSRDGRIDAWFTAPWFDPQTNSFPLQNNRWLELINHRAAKDIVFAFCASVLLRGLWTRNRRLLLIWLMMAAGALTVSLLKAFSTHSCPWDLLQYGGKAQEFLLLNSAPANAGPGRCFPGGHASVGFILMAWFFWFNPRHPYLARLCWCLGLAAGLLLGYGQLMRGAHFLSHNLWTGWWVWLIQVLIYNLLYRHTAHSRRQTISLS